MRITKSGILSIIALVAVLIGIPVLVIVYEANRTGQSPWVYLKALIARMDIGDSDGELIPPSERVSGKTIKFLEGRSIGDPIDDSKPWITNLSIVDLDAD